MEETEKRFLGAIAISFVVLMLWAQFFGPSPAPPEPDPESAAAATSPIETAPEPSLPISTPPTAAIVATDPSETLVATDLFELTLTNRGGRASSWKLRGYTDDAGNAVELIPPDSHQIDRLPLSLWLPGREELSRRLDQALFVVERGPVEGNDGSRGERIAFRYAEVGGISVVKTLEVHDGSYFVDATVSVEEEGKVVPAWLAWGAGFGETAEGHAATARTQALVGSAIVNRGGGIERYVKGKATTPTVLEGEGPIVWAGMETIYFAALMLPAGGSTTAELLPVTLTVPPAAGTNAKEESRPYLELALAPGDATPAHYTLFVGPKDYRLLRAEGHDLARVISFGWPVVREIAQGLFVALVWLYGYLGNHGLAIIVLTLAIRLTFLPIMFKAQIGMRRMQQKTKKIQPKMKAIRERYRKAKMDFKSRQTMNEEIMELYRKEGINPLGGLGGCLPLVLQLPFLYGFYQLLTVTIELRHAPFFGWIHDLSRPDPYYVTPLLMGASMLVQTSMSMSSIADPAQRRMMFIMSIVFMVFFFNLPSGLVIYWLFSNLFGIGQQTLVNRYADRELGATQPKRARAAQS
jgi:YidC/Oxa1 family membrane protein insertase